jgi:hypothetical protein
LQALSIRYPSDEYHHSPSWNPDLVEVKMWELWVFTYGLNSYILREIFTANMDIFNKIRFSRVKSKYMAGYVMFRYVWTHIVRFGCWYACAHRVQWRRHQTHLTSLNFRH